MGLLIKCAPYRKTKEKMDKQILRKDSEIQPEKMSNDIRETRNVAFWKIALFCLMGTILFS